ncbi:hypothetical protein ACTQ2R_03805 [Hallella faecis]|uniref:hypothetical protein n=1 Tax=Hallella faecis TaxID=2841596 RepID=UPI003F8D9A5A
MTKKYSNEYCFLSIFFIFSTPELGVLASKQGQLAYFTWVSQGFNLSRETKALTPAHVPPHFVKFAGASFPPQIFHPPPHNIRAIATFLI